MQKNMVLQYVQVRSLWLVSASLKEMTDSSPPSRCASERVFVFLSNITEKYLSSDIRNAYVSPNTLVFPLFVRVNFWFMRFVVQVTYNCARKSRSVT